MKPRKERIQIVLPKQEQGEFTPKIVPVPMVSYVKLTNVYMLRFFQSMLMP